MKLQDVVVCLKDCEDRLTSDEQETLAEIFVRMFGFSLAKEQVPAGQRELVDQLIRDMDDLAIGAYRLAAALESRQAKEA
jgi:hypothetical protein